MFYLFKYSSSFKFQDLIVHDITKVWRPKICRQKVINIKGVTKKFSFTRQGSKIVFARQLGKEEWFNNEAKVNAYSISK